tara:strand:+ start:6301 stop:6666 length:366 start_codon:yes stop_codon:yes gene_type:complete
MNCDRRQRIRDKVMSRVEVDAETGCWIWTGATSGSNGRGKDYPRMSLDGATVAVHIAMFVVEHGPVPPRKQIDHICNRRLCVNPDHLEMVTHLRNQRRRDRRRIEALNGAPAALVQSEIAS